MMITETLSVTEISTLAVGSLAALAYSLQKYLRNWKSTSTEVSIITMMHTELERMSNQNKLLSDELNKLQRELITLNSELQKMTLENQRLHNEVQEITKQLSRLSARV
jgi:chromosome segregation ATPase